MNTIIEFIIGILTAYLAFTNMLATGIQDIIDTVSAPEESQSTQEEPLGLVPSFVAAIPDILLRSNQYQQAALAGASTEENEPKTDDPLASIVNIFCTFTTEQSIRTTTGTGFFIDSDGVIMTNAHIAQFLLLEKTNAFGEADCTVRTGSPAIARYEAELLYISPTWIQENAALINDNKPMGTGERDYALLYVSKSIDTNALPDVFPALRFESNLLSTQIRGETVLAAGYPANNLAEAGAESALVGKVATTTISELYTFGSNYADVFSVRGSIVGAQGASGGPILTKDKRVIGMIATRGDDSVDGTGSLRAITLSHINRSMEEESGFSLAENLSGDLPFRSQVFADTMSPFLISLLEKNQ